jgi:hypothetical protein
VNRRWFLGLLGTGVAGAVFDPELALWVPGRQTYFDLGTIVRPQPRVSMSQMVAATWEKVMRERGRDVFDEYWLIARTH